MSTVADSVVVVVPGPGAPITVSVAAPPADYIFVEPPGPRGLPGPAGDTVAPTAYQLHGASSWSVEHPYPYPPELRLVDESGQECEVGYEYPDPTHVAIEFPTPFTGTVILS